MPASGRWDLIQHLKDYGFKRESWCKIQPPVEELSYQVKQTKTALL